MILICDHRGSGLSQALRPLKRAGFTLEATQNLRETRERLGDENLELLVVDPLVSGGSVELEELTKLCTGTTTIPMLLVGDPERHEAVLGSASVLEGALWDLIRRDAGSAEFSMRIRRLLGQSRQINELADLRYRAAHDDLTDLLRPLYFQARLEEHFSATERHGLNLSLLLIDLDNFGQINKTFDHTVGDRVLAFTARVIRESLRAEDMAGRIGGDEFAIALPFTGALDAAATVRRLCRTISKISGTIDEGETELVVTASIGFETTDGREVESLQDLRLHAEAALRRAKRAGGNGGVFYRSSP